LKVLANWSRITNGNVKIYDKIESCENFDKEPELSKWITENVYAMINKSNNQFSQSNPVVHHPVTNISQNIQKAIEQKEKIESRWKESQKEEDIVSSTLPSQYIQEAQQQLQSYESSIRSLQQTKKSKSENIKEIEENIQEIEENIRKEQIAMPEKLYTDNAKYKPELTVPDEYRILVSIYGDDLKTVVDSLLPKCYSYLEAIIKVCDYIQNVIEKKFECDLDLYFKISAMILK